MPASTYDILRKTREVIERDGWYQGMYWDRTDELDDNEATARSNCPVCVMGAIGRGLIELEVVEYFNPWAPAASVAYHLLAKACDTYGTRDPVEFNDEIATDVSDVLTVLGLAEGWAKPQ